MDEEQQSAWDAEVQKLDDLIKSCRRRKPLGKLKYSRIHGKFV